MIKLKEFQSAENMNTTKTMIDKNNVSGVLVMDEREREPMIVCPLN